MKPVLLAVQPAQAFGQRSPELLAVAEGRQEEARFDLNDPGACPGLEQNVSNSNAKQVDGIVSSVHS